MRQPFWAFGLLLVVGGSLGDFMALGFAAQSLIVPVGGFTLVANVFFAHYWLKEDLTRLDLLATFMIILGIVLITAFADKNEVTYDIEELKMLYKHTRFYIYLALVVTTCIVMFSIVKHIQKIDAKFGHKSEEYKPWRRVHPVFTAALSGVIGAQSTLFAKSTAELLKKTFGGDNQLNNIVTWVIILAMLCTIFGQIHWLTTALKDFNAVLVVPIFQCFFILFSIISGGVYFNEFAKMTGLQTTMFALGVLVTLSGVVLLASSQASQAQGGEAEKIEGDDAESGIEADEDFMRTQRPSVWDRVDTDASMLTRQNSSESYSVSRTTSVWAPAPFFQMVDQFNEHPEMAPPLFNKVARFWKEVEEREEARPSPVSRRKSMADIDVRKSLDDDSFDGMDSPARGKSKFVGMRSERAVNSPYAAKSHKRADSRRFTISGGARDLKSVSGTFVTSLRDIGKGISEVGRRISGGRKSLDRDAPKVDPKVDTSPRLSAVSSTPADDKAKYGDEKTFENFEFSAGSGDDAQDTASATQVTLT